MNIKQEMIKWKYYCNKMNKCLISLMYDELFEISVENLNHNRNKRDEWRISYYTQPQRKTQEIQTAKNHSEED